MENPKIAPVLFCIYNRLSYTQRSFQQIRKAKPTQLFIAADGPKNKKDKVNCQKNRDWVVKNVDWKCELKLLFSERKCISFLRSFAIPNSLNGPLRKT